MKLDSSHSAEEKARWKVVRTDTYADIEGEIVTADDVTGDYSVQIGNETKTYNLGPNGIRIVRRKR